MTEMANVRDAVNAVVAAIMAQKDYLTAVDAKTGDGDHGLNMARGFTEAQDRLAGVHRERRRRGGSPVRHRVRAGGRGGECRYAA